MKIQAKRNTPENKPEKECVLDSPPGFRKPELTASQKTKRPNHPVNCPCEADGNASRRYQDFLQKSEDQNVLFLGLGAG